MGAAGSIQDSPLLGYLQSEFQRVLKEGSKLHLDQVRELQPPQDANLDLRHIATLWRLDADHDGGVTFQELLDFAEFCNERKRIVGDLDFLSKLKAQCDVELWDVIKDDQGQDVFASWVILLVSQGDPLSTFAASPTVRFVSRDTVMTLYELLQPYQISSHIDQQGFLDMMQQIGENMGLMSLQAEELDDWVPVEVVKGWVKSFIAAYANLFRELDLQPPRAASEDELALAAAS